MKVMTGGIPLEIIGLRHFRTIYQLFYIFSISKGVTIIEFWPLLAKLATNTIFYIRPGQRPHTALNVASPSQLHLKFSE